MFVNTNTLRVVPITSGLALLGCFIGRIGAVSRSIVANTTTLGFMCLTYISSVSKHAVFSACLTQLYFILLIPLISMSLVGLGDVAFVVFIVSLLYLAIVMCAFMSTLLMDALHTFEAWLEGWLLPSKPLMGTYFCILFFFTALPMSRKLHAQLSLMSINSLCDIWFYLIGYLLIGVVLISIVSCFNHRHYYDNCVDYRMMAMQYLFIIAVLFPFMTLDIYNSFLNSLINNYDFTLSVLPKDKSPIITATTADLDVVTAVPTNFHLQALNKLALSGDYIATAQYLTENNEELNTEATNPLNSAKYHRKHGITALSTETVIKNLENASRNSFILAQAMHPSVQEVVNSLPAVLDTPFEDKWEGILRFYRPPAYFNHTNNTQVIPGDSDGVKLSSLSSNPRNVEVMDVRENKVSYKSTPQSISKSLNKNQASNSSLLLPINHVYVTRPGVLAQQAVVTVYGADANLSIFEEDDIVAAIKQSIGKDTSKPVVLHYCPSSVEKQQLIEIEAMYKSAWKSHDNMMEMRNRHIEMLQSCTNYKKLLKSNEAPVGSSPVQLSQFKLHAQPRVICSNYSHVVVDPGLKALLKTKAMAVKCVVKR